MLPYWYECQSLDIQARPTQPKIRWFVIRNDEALLKDLEEKWHLTALQTNWKIEPVLHFSGDSNALSLNHEDPATEVEAGTSSDTQPPPTSDAFLGISESLPMEGVNSHHTNGSLSHLHNSTLSITYFNARSVFCKLDNLKLVCAIPYSLDITPPPFYFFA